MLENLQSFIPPHSRMLIENSHIILRDSPDKLIWNENSNGVFTCQSAYRAIRRTYVEPDVSKSHWAWIWKTNFNNKVKHFIWLLVQGKLATNELRLKRKLVVSAGCSLPGVS